MQIGTANAAAVVALYGPPDAEGWFFGDRSYPPSHALGYECVRKRDDDRWPVTNSGPWCRTVFWVDPATGELGDFFTSSRRFVAEHGVRVGMPTVVAERLLHRHAQGGCSDAINRDDLTIWFAGDTLWQLPSNELRVIGGHVDSFFLVNPRGELGIFDC